MSLLAGILVLSVCIVIHELGHLLLGRMVGIRATVFSFGYGRGVFSKNIGGTVYQITAIPLGGYVKFSGDDIIDRHKSKPGDFFYAGPLRRIIPVIGGPLFNLLLGVVILTIFNMIGYDRPSTRIITQEKILYVDPTTGDEKRFYSPAYKAGIRSGDRIVSIDKQPVSTFSDIQFAVMMGDGMPMEIAYRHSGALHTVTVTPQYTNPSSFPKIGVSPFVYYGLKEIVAGGPLEKAGFRKGDTFIAINDQIIVSMDQLMDILKKNPGRKVRVRVERRDKDGNPVLLNKDLTIIPKMRILFRRAVPKGIKDTEIKDFDLVRLDDLQKRLRLGGIEVNGVEVHSIKQFRDIVSSSVGKRFELSLDGDMYEADIAVKEMGYVGGVFGMSRMDTIRISFGPFRAVSAALYDAYDFTEKNIVGIGKLISGQLDVGENLSGPIRIAKIAGDIAESGWGPLFMFMAHISIILMFMNLLPIPVVDGGHILFFLIEAIRGRPIDLKIQERIMTAGVLFLMILGIYVIFNDILSLDFIARFIKSIS